MRIKNHQPVICDDNWIDANQVHLGCLSLNNLSKMRYSEAKTYCKSIHSHLVEVHSEAAMRFVVQQLRSLGLQDSVVCKRLIGEVVQSWRASSWLKAPTSAFTFKILCKAGVNQ